MKESSALFPLALLSFHQTYLWLRRSSASLCKKPRTAVEAEVVCWFGGESLERPAVISVPAAFAASSPVDLSVWGKASERQH